MLVNAKIKTAKISMKELEDGPPSLFQDLGGSPPCASFAARQTFDAPCVSTNSKIIAEEIAFVIFFGGKGERLPSLQG